VAMINMTSESQLRNWYSQRCSCPGCHGEIRVVTFNLLSKSMKIIAWCSRCKDWDFQEL
jgi:hypothetical protein